MITVAIFINNEPILIRSAVNQDAVNDLGETKYLNNFGEVIWHKREDGAIALAKKILRDKKRHLPAKSAIRYNKKSGGRNASSNLRKSIDEGPKS